MMPPKWHLSNILIKVEVQMWKAAIRIILPDGRARKADGPHDGPHALRNVSQPCARLGDAVCTHGGVSGPYVLR